jgi:CheY-like chemotaxis protein
MKFPTGQFPRRTVLLVDDDATLRTVLARALADAGYWCFTAKNGEQALTLATSLAGQLGLVVTDIRMPVMDGLELAAHLSRLDPAPPVLFISGYCSATSVIPGPVLQKPFGPATFLKQVGRLLSGAFQRA